MTIKQRGWHHREIPFPECKRVLVCPGGAAGAVSTEALSAKKPLQLSIKFSNCNFCAIKMANNSHLELQLCNFIKY